MDKNFELPTNHTPSGQTLAIENALKKLKAAVQPVDMQVQRNEDGSVKVVCSAENAILVHTAMIAATGTSYQALSERLVRQTASAIVGEATLEAEVQAVNLVTRALLEIAPRDGVEGMLAAQMVAVHNQAMECLKSAMKKGLPVDVAANYRSQAVKLMRTFTAQMETLKRNRTGGKQKMTIKHVHVHQGGQAVIGVQAGDGGGGMDNGKQPDARFLSPRCGAKCKRTGLPFRGPAMANGRCRMHGGKSTGPPKGNKNALKHGGYTAAAIAQRRYVNRLVRESQELLKEIEGV